MSRRLETVRELFRLFDEEGIDAMLASVPDDVVWAPLSAEGRAYVGAEIRAHFDAQRDDAAEQTQHLLDLQEVGDAVIASGSVQIRSRRTHVDFQPCWVYEFDGERLRRATGYPTRRAALAALAERTRAARPT